MSWKSIPQQHLMKVNEILEALKRHDIETFSHCMRVSHLCGFLADAAELSSEEKLQAQMAGLLHDVGKMKIPLKVLNKPGKLNDDEYNLMKNHALYSAELLQPLEEDEFFREVQMSVLHHHERVDGKGYPFEIEDEQIPYTSRLILIVDTVDAMTQTRAYRKGLSMPVVYKELEKFSGTQFDGDLVEVFVSAYRKVLEKEQRNAVINIGKKIKIKAA